MRLSPTAFINRQLKGMVMSNLDMDAIERKLLGLLQRDFPLVREPYRELARKLALSENEVVAQIEKLKAKGIVRQISPVLDARRLGYQSTLVAMKVAQSGLRRAEQTIVQHPGVSHAYERDHEFNIWFTLSLPPMVNIDPELQRMTRDSGSDAAFALPAVKIFKIGAYFGVDGEEQPSSNQSDTELPHQVELPLLDRQVINVLQKDLPLTSAPFDAIATEARMDVTDFLTQCQSLIQRRVIRRFGAAVNHVKIGFQANAMTCWVAPPEVVDSAGRQIASLPEVSHCHERKTNSLWPHNLFAMIHGYTKEECHTVASRVAAETGLEDYLMLFSTREFKKTRVKYLV